MTKPKGPGRVVLRKGRHSQPNGVYFITFTTEDRIPWFQQFDLACTMCRCIDKAINEKGTEVMCWVVMPDHLHLLLCISEENLSSVVRRLKAGSARCLNRQIGRNGRFWMPGYYDHCLRREESIRETARYIVGNPIRANLVDKCADYAFWNAIWI